jgi:hypothetical protein
MIISVQCEFSAGPSDWRSFEGRTRSAAHPIEASKDDFVMNFKRNALLSLMGLLIAGSAVTGASAQDVHPRRDQVNDRIAHQHERIREARREGEMTPRRAARLHRAEFKVRMQERRDARFHHGHITPAEQRHLNGEENRISRHMPS